MSCFYFTNIDVRSTRAHVSQVLHTVDACSLLTLVAPRYPGTDLETIKRRHDLTHELKAVFLWNFGIRSPGIFSFVVFNLSAMLFLLVKKMQGEADGIYIRSSYFVPLVFMAFMLRVPCFYETHRRPMSFSERLRDWFVAHIAIGYVAVSEQVRRYYARYPARAIVVHDAVALRRFSVHTLKEDARARLGMKRDQRVCVYTGAVSALKGVDCLVSAARLLPRVSFLLAGRINPEFEIVPMPPNVILMGEREQSELPVLLSAADVLVLPHPDNDYSQSPMKLFEYMASGVPIVASRLPSLEEVLNDRNAVLVRAGSAEALATGITQVLNDCTRAEALGAQARCDVEAYTWEARGEKIARLVRETLKA